MNNPFIKISLSLTLLLLTVASFAQHYSFTNYSLEEGLPQSEVSSLIQDTKGNLWLGTNGGGLSRFNGKKFISYNNDDGLADNNIRSLFQDKKENMLVKPRAYDLNADAFVEFLENGKKEFLNR